MSQQVRSTTTGLDTIAAIATPPGTAGIAVIRISGDASFDVAAEVFEGADLMKVASHTVHHGRIVGTDGSAIDDVLLTVFRAPRSYTGEDTVEISCHGGSITSRAVLTRVCSSGARHAEPGEFTRRAFLNGKLDLAQAEAVADLIHAQSEEARCASIEQLEGALSVYVREIRERLLKAASMLELSLDFVEEDVTFLSSAELDVLIEDALTEMTAALESYGSGRIIRDGIRVALLGPPNVGKSSLLNALLGMRRAIVTDVPGTTRDYIEEQMLLQGEYFRFIDTAGVRDTDDSIEQEGIAIGRRVLQRADIVCVITDACDGLSASNAMMAQLKPENAEYEMFAVFNKSDLVSREVEEELNRHGVALSALHGQGIPTLTERLTELAHSMRSGSEKGRVLVTNARHADCLRRGIHALEAARRAGTEGMTEEFLAYEVRQAIEALGEIIGDVTTDDILNGIFSRFCIGK